MFEKKPLFNLEKKCQEFLLFLNPNILISTLGYQQFLESCGNSGFIKPQSTGTGAIPTLRYRINVQARLLFSKEFLIYTFKNVSDCFNG